MTEPFLVGRRDEKQDDNSSQILTVLDLLELAASGGENILRGKHNLIDLRGETRRADTVQAGWTATKGHQDRQTQQPCLVSIYHPE